MAAGRADGEEPARKRERLRPGRRGNEPGIRSAAVGAGPGRLTGARQAAEGAWYRPAPRPAAPATAVPTRPASSRAARAHDRGRRRAGQYTTVRPARAARNVITGRRTRFPATAGRQLPAAVADPAQPPAGTSYSATSCARPSVWKRRLKPTTAGDEPASVPSFSWSTA